MGAASTCSCSWRHPCRLTCKVVRADHRVPRHAAVPQRQRGCRCPERPTRRGWRRPVHGRAADAGLTPRIVLGELAVGIQRQLNKRLIASPSLGRPRPALAATAVQLPLSSGSRGNTTLSPAYCDPASCGSARARSAETRSQRGRARMAFDQSPARFRGTLPRRGRPTDPPPRLAALAPTRAGSPAIRERGMVSGARSTPSSAPAASFLDGGHRRCPVAGPAHSRFG